MAGGLDRRFGAGDTPWPTGGDPTACWREIRRRSVRVLKVGCQRSGTTNQRDGKKAAAVSHVTVTPPRDIAAVPGAAMSLVVVKNLTFVPQGAREPALDNISLSLPEGSRTLLIGANGGQPRTRSPDQTLTPTSKIAGKSTLLQILAGKRLIKGADVTIKGLDVFYQFPEGVTFLGTEWSASFLPINRIPPY